MRLLIAKINIDMTEMSSINQEIINRTKIISKNKVVYKNLFNLFKKKKYTNITLLMFII